MKFADWVSTELALSTEQIDVMHLINAFDVLACRCDAAAHRGAPVPLITISPRRAGGNSRAATRNMLAQLGYTGPQLRVIHRLLAGSTGGWPGLLTLFTSGQQVQPWHRRYVRIRCACSSMSPAGGLSTAGRVLVDVTTRAEFRRLAAR